MNSDEIKVLMQITANKIIDFIKKRFFDIMALILAVLAVWVSIITLDRSVEQFQQNANSSDSLFKMQLKNSKELNDSLISQIITLQNITNNQLIITDQQLNISKDIYQDQLYSRRPVITVTSVDIADTNVYYQGRFAPVISVHYKNIGQRNAYNSSHRHFIEYIDYSNGQWINADFKDLSEIDEPNVESSTLYKPKIPTEQKENFFYCFEFRYIDKTLKREFIQSYYRHYLKNRDKYDFYNCNGEEKARIKANINRQLKIEYLPLFDEH
jgi:hypothetical protein